MLKNDLNQQPDITVYMTAKNEEADIERAILALREQPGLDIEILVNDDGSTDNTAEVARNLGVKVFTNRTSKGVPKSLNKLLTYATGKYLFNTDADDYIAPEALSMLFAQAEQCWEFYKHQFFVYGNTMYHTGDTTREHKQQATFADSPFYRHNPICSDILVPRESFTEDKIKYIEERYIHEDWAYMLSLIEAGYKGVPVNTLVLHYFHDNKGNYAEMGTKATENMKKYFRMK